MDKLCTLLLPSLQDGARVDWAVCVGEHPGHQAFSRGPWPEYRRAPPRRQFRQRDSIVSVMMQITGSGRRERIFDVVIRSATLLAHAHAAAATVGRQPTTGAAGGADDNEGDIGAGGANGRDVVGGGVPWAEWGPRATSMSDQSMFAWNDLLSERRATIDEGGRRIRINDYNPYRIRQARASGLAQGGGHRGGEEDSGGDSDEGGEGDVFRQKSARRITEGNRIRGGEWFREDVSTALPHLDITVSMPAMPVCRAIYMEQDQLLLQVDDLNNFTEWSNRPVMEGFLLYRM